MEEGELQEVAIRKIGIFSVAKYLAIFGILSGLLLGIVLTAVFFQFPQISNYMGAYSWVGNYLMILPPVVFGISWFILGIIGILIYNIFARFIGGIRLYS